MVSKTKKTALGAYHFGGQLMIIPTDSAENLFLNILNLNYHGTYQRTFRCGLFCRSSTAL